MTDLKSKRTHRYCLQMDPCQRKVMIHPLKALP
uniref:Uncharacterized protein n=1 Tax=Anguilla anguilla TaxID=7936 RepID=A0A0E9XY75_ANGAN